MPVIKIRALPQKPDINISAVLSETCLDVAAACNLAKHQVWATWETLNPRHFVEGDRAVDQQPNNTHPPIVNLIAFEGRSDEVIERMIAAATNALAEELKLAPGNIFLTYTEMRSGRIFTGGAIRYLRPYALLSVHRP